MYSGAISTELHLEPGMVSKCCPEEDCGGACQGKYVGEKGPWGVNSTGVASKGELMGDMGVRGVTSVGCGGE